VGGQAQSPRTDWFNGRPRKCFGCRLLISLSIVSAYSLLDGGEGGGEGMSTLTPICCSLMNLSQPGCAVRWSVE
jgi:hypothetical protein